LERLNDHLGRFLHHADSLVAEWERHGTAIRASVEAQVAQLDGALNEAVAKSAERAVGQVGARIERGTGDAVERALGDGLQRLRAELDELTAAAASARTARGGGGARGAARETARAVVLPLVLANLVLVAVLAILLFARTDGGNAAPPAGARPATIPASPCPAPQAADHETQSPAGDDKVPRTGDTQGKNPDAGEGSRQGKNPDAGEGSRQGKNPDAGEGSGSPDNEGAR
jgi:hypothetical protein